MTTTIIRVASVIAVQSSFRLGLLPVPDAPPCKEGLLGAGVWCAASEEEVS